MADLPRLQSFAAAHAYDVTAPLTHQQVRALANYWLPEMRFHWKERYHPIRLEDQVGMVERLFNQLPATAQEQWKVTKDQRGSGGTLDSRPFPPPVVYVPDGVIAVQQQFRKVVKVLNPASPAANSLDDPPVGRDAAISHGASGTAAHQFFGGDETLSGATEPAPGDPLLPRARLAGREDDDAIDARRVTVIAVFRNLLETLQFDLLTEKEPGYPPNALNAGFDTAVFFRHPTLQAPLDAGVRREHLLQRIAAFQAGGPIDFEVGGGWFIDRTAWNALTQFAFLEYYYFYAYNDFDRYQTTPFENEHEGDDEGCCLVFERRTLAAHPQLRGVPHSIITSVHEEFQDADEFKTFQAPSPLPPSPREHLDPVRVYVAGGSHATYLTSGEHDLVDFQDLVDGTLEKLGAWSLILPIPIVIIILALIIEHFVDTEDFTSDDGVHSGDATNPANVKQQVHVLPMSGGNHIYRQQHTELLRLYAYPGKWGGHDGFSDVSPQFQHKTGRFFRKLVRNLSA